MCGWDFFRGVGFLGVDKTVFAVGGALLQVDTARASSRYMQQHTANNTLQHTLQHCCM